MTTGQFPLSRREVTAVVTSAAAVVEVDIMEEVVISEEDSEEAGLAEVVLVDTEEIPVDL